MAAKNKIISTMLAFVLLVGVIFPSTNVFATSARNFDSLEPTFAAGSDSTTPRQEIVLGKSSLGSSAWFPLTWNITGPQAKKYDLYGDPQSDFSILGRSGDTMVAYLGVAQGAVLEIGDEATITVQNGADVFELPIIVTDNGTPIPPQTTVLKGTAYVYKKGVKVPAKNVRVTIYNKNWRYLGSVLTGTNGEYTIPVRDSLKTDTYMVAAYSYDSFYLLNKDETEFATGNLTVLGASLESGYDFAFVQRPNVRVRVVDKNTGTGIAGARISTGGYVYGSGKTDNNGDFISELSSYYPNAPVYVYYNVYADTYFNKYERKQAQSTINILDFKNQTGIDMGTIALKKSPFSDTDRNQLQVIPSSVSSGETSHATLYMYSETDYRNAYVTISGDSDSIPLVKDAGDVQILEDGVPIAPRNVNSYRNTVNIYFDIKAGKQYKIGFGMKAPAIGNGQNAYLVEAKVNNHMLVGSQYVTIQDLSVYAPPEVGNHPTFTVFGEALAKNNSDIRLTITAPDGNAVYTGTTKSKGYLYEFANIALTNLMVGEYAIVAEAYQPNESTPYATATTNMLVVEGPVALKGAEIGDQWNKVTSDGSKPLSFNAWVDGRLHSLDYRNLYGSVTLEGIVNVDKVDFVLETNYGAFRWAGTKSGDSYRAYLRQFQGSGKATLFAEVTKLDGTKITIPIGKLIILIDPSGYVYDKQTNERIEGAEATLYYKDENGAWSIWPADDYMQVNPQKTDKEGKYGWMVPEGEYEVRVKANGYNDYSTLPPENYGVIHVLPERKDVNIGLTKPYTGGGTTSSRGSSSSSSKGSNRPDGVPSYLNNEVTWLSNKEVTSRIRSAQENKVRFRGKGIYGIRLKELKRLRDYTLVYDTLVGKTVVVRVSIPTPELATTDLKLNGYVSGTTVQKTKNQAAKYFTNSLQVIVFEQNGTWGQEVEIAAKIDLKNMDTSDLVFYSYNPKANRYEIIKGVKYRIDSNGYLRLTTEKAGVIIVSDGVLERK